jgi:hypothetical protein
VIVLAGDSVFDNASYSSPSLIAQFGKTARLIAVDGAVIVDVVGQTERGHVGPSDLLVISVGGNDVLPFKEHLFADAPPDEILSALSDAVDAFEERYTDMLGSVSAEHRGDLAVCTIYNGNFPLAERAAIRAAVRMFNDAIYRCAYAFSAQVLDLRDLFTGDDDFANSIEPSAQGSRKIAGALLAMRGVR